MQHVDVAEQVAGLRVTAPAHQAQPARQAQLGQRLGYRLVRGSGATGRAGEERPQLFVGREGGLPAVIEQQAKDLPSVALQRGQAVVEKQPSGHGLVAVAAVEVGVTDGRADLRRLQRLQGVVE